MSNESQGEGVLTAAAQLIGKAAGKVATLAGGKPKGEEQIKQPPKPRPAKRQMQAKGKLQKKVKADPPRRVKKAHKKARMAG